MRFLSTFNDRLYSTIRYYASIDQHLASRFYEDIDEVCRQLDRFPNLGRTTAGYRTLALKHFPFSVCYKVTPEGPLALVLYHQKSSKTGMPF